MTLSVLWFILIAVLWIGYLTLEGFGFGGGMIYKFVAKDERERRALSAPTGTVTRFGCSPLVAPPSLPSPSGTARSFLEPT